MLCLFSFFFSPGSYSPTGFWAFVLKSGVNFRNPRVFHEFWLMSGIILPLVFVGQSFLAYSLFGNSKFFFFWDVLVVVGGWRGGGYRVFLVVFSFFGFWRLECFCIYHLSSLLSYLFLIHIF